MNILKKIRNWVPIKHNFDLEDFEKIIIEDYSFNRYKCKKCNKIMTLNLWQMKILPRSMAYGCTK